MKLGRARSSPGARSPHVAVVVPCYNYGHFLGDCVQSIVSQPGVTTEVVIIDDASSDDSAVVAGELAERYREVSLVRHDRNIGHIATYNEGLSTEDSDYLVLLSADDMLAPGALRRATGLMEAHPSVGLAYGNPQVFTDVPQLADSRFNSWSVWRGDRWIGAQFKRGLSLIYGPEAVVRTSVHHAAGYYRPELPHSGDLELWLRIAAISDVGRVNGPDQAFRRVHAASMMQSNYGTVVEDLVRRDDAYESFLASAGEHLSNADELRSTIRRRMSQEALGWACSVLASGFGAPDDLDRAIAFATDIYPGYSSLRVWRELQYRIARGQPPGFISQIGGWSDAASRDLSQRVRWRRWRYFGV
jgi:glycosyltransferase involved in cell wall biosynthesis